MTAASRLGGCPPEVVGVCWVPRVEAQLLRARSNPGRLPLSVGECLLRDAEEAVGLGWPVLRD